MPAPTPFRRCFVQGGRSRPHPLAAGLIAALQVLPGFAQPADPVRILADQGTYWQSRGDSARAAEAWRKLLGISPRNPDALYGLGQAALDVGRPDAARDYLEQLRRASPGYPRIARLAQDIATGRDGTQIQQAREQARSGNAVDALASYRAVLAGRDPEGPLALEYYQTLGATPQGWDEARHGLERLARQSPDDSRVALALAQHLSYRETTRREGIAQLSRLATQAEVGRQAAESWRRALDWTGSRPGDAPLYQAYLQAHPDDATIRSRLVATRQRDGAGPAAAVRDPLRRMAAAAFGSLDAGDIAAAESGFQRVLAARPDDGGALGGLGIVRLRQENFPEARTLLERAARHDPAGRWRPARDSARYWTLAGQAQAARARGDTDSAAQALEEAVRIDPAEPAGRIALGDTLAAGGRYEQAEAAYRQVLARRADHPDAVRGLAGVLARTGQDAEALALVERLDPRQQALMGDALGRLRAAPSVAAARSAAQRGDDAAALRALQAAQAQDPSSPWIRLDLARLLRKTGAVAEARAVAESLAASGPDRPDALYASALLAAEWDDAPGALATLEQIAPPSRTRDMATLQRRAWVQVQAAQAVRLVGRGRATEARALLAQAATFAAPDRGLLGVVAGAYADTGDTARALALARPLLAGQPEVGVQLLCASVLLKAGQDTELPALLRRLQATPMDAAQRQGFDDLRVAYAVRQVDALREAGRPAAARAAVAPLVDERPDDVQVLGALARVQAAEGDAAQALATYRPLLLAQPHRLDLLLAVAGAATAAHAWRDAEAAIDAALLRAPRSPEALAAAGRLARAQGQRTRAVERFTASLDAEDRQRDGTAATSSPDAAPMQMQMPTLEASTPDVYAAPVDAAGAPPAVTVAVATAPGMPVLAPPAALEPPGPGSIPPPAAATLASSPAGLFAWGRDMPSLRVGGGFAAQPAPVPGAGAGADSGSGSGERAAPPGASASVRDELAVLEQMQSISMTLGAIGRFRQGEPGTSRLADGRMPVELRVPIEDAQLVLRITPVLLRAGTPGSAFGNLSRFGGGPDAALHPGMPAPGGQRAGGVGVSVGYESDRVMADIGTTPLGFGQPEIDGGVRFKGPIDDSAFVYSIELSRRAVTDSLLAFAGTRDGRAGLEWGGVSATGGRLQLGWDSGGWGAYGFTALHAITGSQVQRNTRAELGGGVYAHLVGSAHTQLTAGLALNASAYDRNVRYFTYGHGGYFSPQQYVSAAVPIEFAQRSGRLSYHLRSSVGLQHFREDAAAYFPTGGALQNAAQAAMAGAAAFGLAGRGAQAVYPGQSKTGPAYDLGAAIEYQIGQQTFLGGHFATHNASNFRQTIGGVYLRYSMQPYNGPAALPVQPFRSPYAY